MTTDVINGVPRSLLERTLKFMDDTNSCYPMPYEVRQEFRALLATAQPAADVEREAFEAYCQSIGYTLKTGDAGRYLGGYGEEIWAGWKARAALPAKAEGVAVPEGWGIKLTDDGEGFIVSTPRLNGVSGHTAVFPDDNDPAHRLLWQFLAAAPPRPSTAALKELLPELDDALENLEIHGRHSDQGYRKLKDWYRKAALATGAIDAALAAHAQAK